MSTSKSFDRSNIVSFNSVILGDRHLGRCRKPNEKPSNNRLNDIAVLFNVTPPMLNAVFSRGAFSNEPLAYFRKSLGLTPTDHLMKVLDIQLERESRDPMPSSEGPELCNSLAQWNKKSQDSLQSGDKLMECIQELVGIFREKKLPILAIIFINTAEGIHKVCRGGQITSNPPLPDDLIDLAGKCENGSVMNVARPGRRSSRQGGNLLEETESDIGQKTMVWAELLDENITMFQIQYRVFCYTTRRRQARDSGGYFGNNPDRRLLILTEYGFSMDAISQERMGSIMKDFLSAYGIDAKPDVTEKNSADRLLDDMKQAGCPFVDIQVWSVDFSFKFIPLAHRYTTDGPAVWQVTVGDESFEFNPNNRQWPSLFLRALKKWQEAPAKVAAGEGGGADCMVAMAIDLDSTISADHTPCVVFVFCHKKNSMLVAKMLEKWSFDQNGGDGTVMKTASPMGVDLPRGLPIDGQKT